MFYSYINTFLQLIPSLRYQNNKGLFYHLHILVIVSAVALTSACSGDTSSKDGSESQSAPENEQLEVQTPPSASPQSYTSSNPQATTLSDSLILGTYGRSASQEYAPRTIHIQVDSRVQFVFEKEINVYSGSRSSEETRLAKAVWTSTWEAEGDAIVLSRENDYYVAEGEMMGGADEVPLNYWPYDNIPPDSQTTIDSLAEIDQLPSEVYEDIQQGIFLADIASAMKRTIEQMDTCVVRLLRERNGSEKKVFLLPSNRIQLGSSAKSTQRTFSQEDLRYNFHKPY